MQMCRGGQLICRCSSLLRHIMQRCVCLQKVSDRAQQLCLNIGLWCVVLSERDAWVRMPAMKGACGACSSSLPCPKARATSLAHRHRAARALLVSPMRIRYWDDHTSNVQCPIQKAGQPTGTECACHACQA